MLENTLLYSDKEIIAGIQTNRSASLKALYAKNYDAIFDFVINNNGDEKDVQRIFHEGIIILVRNIRKGYFLEEKSLRTILYSICRQQWIRELEQRSPFVVNINDKLGYVEFDKNTNNRLSEDEIMYDNTEKALQQLGEPGGTIIKLFYVKRMKLSDIAIEIGYADIANALNQKNKYVKRFAKSFFSNPKGVD